jgi:hypothetical protein
MAEWTIAPALKAGGPKGPGVRIPLSPPFEMLLMGSSIKCMKKLLYLLVAISVVSVACNSDNSVSTTTTIQPTTTTRPIEPVRIAAVGDVSCGSSQRRSGAYDCMDQQVAQVVANYAPSYTLLLGDIQYPSHGIDDFHENFLPLWEGVSDVFLPIPGNHEYESNIEENFYAAWGKRGNGVAYYSTEINNDWVVIGLDTNDNCSIIACDIGSDQYGWFASELQKYSDKCIIVMAHHPRYSSGAHGSNSSVADIFDLAVSNDVLAWLSGHDHHYERFNAPIPQFVIGTGGKDLRGVGQALDNSTIAIDNAHGVALLEIEDRSLAIDFVDISGQILDSSVINCAN